VAGRRLGGPRGEGQWPQALDERPPGVRQPRSTCEAGEQRRGTGGGAGGGKAAGQGERGPAKRAPDAEPGPWRVKCAGSCAPSRKQDRDARFTALLHHVGVDRLRDAYRALSPSAAAGVDAVTWESYGQDLEVRLRDLHGRVQRGVYRAKPSRRVDIPKADGRLRPLGIAALEDKIVQRAVVEVLNAIYETDFLGFSYGFRPGRGPHDALDALVVGIDGGR
jgi:RNA-directed DNA polymerase